MKQFLLSLAMLIPLAAGADDNKWCLITDTDVEIELSSVGFLLAADDADAFSVVCTDGNVYNGVASVSFAQLDSSAGISDIMADNEVTVDITSTVLTIIGCKDGTTAAVYSIDGMQLLSKQLSSSDNSVYIGNLSSGVYILKAGATSVKFRKK